MAALLGYNESNTISMVVQEWEEDQVEQFSPVYRINGYPWRLRIYKGDGEERNVSLICEKSNEAELWGCAPIIRTFEISSGGGVMTWPWGSRRFASWGESVFEFEICRFAEKLCTVGYKFNVTIKAIADGESWRRRPILDPLEPRDGILVFGEEKKTIEINKKSLASQSPFFDRLFFGDFKEKNMEEIPIGDVEYEEFSNIIKLVYRFEGASLTDENVFRVLELADRFELKIVEDCAVSYLLSSSSSFSIHEKLLFSEQSNFPFMREILISLYTREELRELSESDDWDQLPKETIRALFKRSCMNSLK